MHSSMKIADEFYSKLNDREIQNPISNLGNSLEQNEISAENIDALISLLKSLKDTKRTQRILGNNQT